MTGAEQDVLRVLDGEPDGITAAYVGDALWGRRHRLPQHWARPAGKILHRLQRGGLCHVLSDRWHRRVWRITAQGQRALRHPEARS